MKINYNQNQEVKNLIQSNLIIWQANIEKQNLQ
jgi:hypothetical protein